MYVLEGGTVNLLTLFCNYPESTGAVNKPMSHFHSIYYSLALDQNE